MNFKRNKSFLVGYWVVLLLFTALNIAAQSNNPYQKKLYHEHDLVSLPDWGPYTKNYIGISHIADKEQGIRFDLSVFPGYYRGKVDAPNVKYASGFHPWEVSPKMEYFSYRHELEWKDQVYTDISYSKIDSQATLIQIEAVNNTMYNQSIAIHLMGSIHFPKSSPFKAKDLVPAKIALPDYSVWKEAIDYEETSTFTKFSHYLNLPHLGKKHGERRRSGTVNGSCLETSEKNDKLNYTLQTEKEIQEALLVIRYRLKEPSDSKLQTQTNGIEKEVKLLYESDYTLAYVPLGKIAKGELPLHLTNLEDQSVFLDGFALVEKKEKETINITKDVLSYVPKLIDGPSKKTVIIKYKNIDTYYGIKWNFDDFQVREWYVDGLSDLFKKQVNNNYSDLFKKEGSTGHFTNVYMRPVTLKANSKQYLYAYVYSGTKEDVFKKLQNGKVVEKSVIQKAKANLIDLEKEIVPAGNKYLFSNKLFMANILGNLEYPRYTQGQYIKHYSPGRHWDIFYTWDAGFTDLGLAQLDAQNATEHLNTYLNDLGEQAAFIHHGSMVPVQHYVFKEIWEKNQSKEYLSYFYPKLKKYYDFYVGKSGSSTMADFESGLIKTWDYFYNSGGWDDYPPQKHVHKHKLTKKVAPVINTAQSIRIAKIMKQAANHLGLNADVKIYNQDIERLSKALQTHAWDEDSGYFGYVLHDENKNARGIMKYENTVNYNMGMDGAYPIVAGICTSEQEKVLLEKLKTEGRLWSKIGLSAVDQKAPYYSREGYWNGSVWMPHQWFFWKAMLDKNQPDFAFKIAKTALDLWKKETERTYDTYEHFMIESESGAGWHQFSGLSTPVMCWFTAYYRMGNLTTGHNVWTSSKKWNEDHSKLTAELILDYNKGENFSLVAVMNPNDDYKILWNGKEVEAQELHKGALSITLNAKKNREKGILKIERKK